MADDRSEQGGQVFAQPIGCESGAALQSPGVNHGEIGLFVVGPEVDEKIEGGVDHCVGAGGGPVDLVDDDYGLVPALQRLLEDEARLRHRPLDGVDEQHHPVDHVHDALDFTAEVGVPGGVDDIDGRAVVDDAGVLGQDRDAPLALEIVGVEDAVGDLLVGLEDIALLEHAVDQGGFPVVDVGDDGDVADGGAGCRLHRVLRCGFGLGHQSSD